MKKTDSATEADWGFTKNEDIMAALDLAVRRIASFGSIDYDDLQQEALLYLSVRPELWKRCVAEGKPFLLTRHIQRYLATESKAAAQRAHITRSYEELVERLYDE